jgi:photosystem II stability/assembly factor-like uncharacterized protein
VTTPEEDELRRAFESRSGAPSPEFRSRLSQALAVRPGPTSMMPAIAVATVLVLTVTSVGVLVAARHFGRLAGLAASGARTESPSPNSKAAGGFNYEISAPTANVVWALYDPDKLYRSTDGGSSWQIRSIPSPYGVHPSVSFINDQEGWWLAPASPVSQCGAQLADIWHTVDGGATWQDLGERVDKTQCKDGIWFVDATHGFVSAFDQDHPPAVYYTSDAGNTWKFGTLPDPADFKSMPGGFTLRVQWLKQLGGRLYLLAYGMQGAGSPYPAFPNRQYIYTSVDGGASWSVVTKVVSRSVVMVTESWWLDLEGGGQSMESTNGGQQFHQFKSNFFTDPANNGQIVFPDSQVGFASGPGYLQRTQDGGLSWTRLAPPGLGNVTPTEVPSPSPGLIPMPGDARLSAPSANVVWALVATQYLFRSTDQGATWQPMPLPAGTYFTDLSFVDDKIGWVSLSGPGGTQCSFSPVLIWRTTDAGAHWTSVVRVDSPFASGPRVAGSIAGEQCKENMSFVDGQHGFLDAWDPNSPPTIYRTSDGGLTWSSSRLADPSGFKTYGAGDALQAGPVKAFGGTLLVDASGMQPDGAHSYVFKSTDGGATWQYVVSMPQSSSPEVEFVTATRWLEIQSGLESTDAGKSWHPFTTDYNDAAGVSSVFVFADDKVGYSTVRGDVHRTVDGGGHWELIKTSWP